MTDSNLDINNTLSNEYSYKKIGSISQLFIIVKDNPNFCLLEKKYYLVQNVLKNIL